MSHQQILWAGVALCWIGFLIMMGILPLPKEISMVFLVGLGMVMWGMTEEKKK